MRIILLALLLCASQTFSQQTYSGRLLLENNLKETIKKDVSSTYTLQPVLQAKKKNAGLAILYSLLLPGMGELYAEGYSSGKYFTIAEVSLWGVYFGIDQYANWNKDRYKSYAASVAEVSVEGKDADYFATLGQYMDVKNYNDEKALNRDFEAMYNENTYYWKWADNNQRKNYRSMWVTSEQSFNSLRFIVGAMLLNRVVSAINAVRLVSAYNKKQLETSDWSLSFGVEQKVTLPASLTINFSTGF